MRGSTLEIRVGSPDELRALWLDDIADGGIFAPGVFPVSAGDAVTVRISIVSPASSATLVGTVVWRRLPRRAAQTSSMLRAGLGIAFDRSMRSRVLFLERLARGAARDVRYDPRYQTELDVEFSVHDEERTTVARVVDVSPHGAHLLVARSALLSPALLSPALLSHALLSPPVPQKGAVQLWLAPPGSGESTLSGLGGRVAWLHAVAEEAAAHLGVRLELTTREERVHWARVVTRSREELERDAHRVDILVG